MVYNMAYIEPNTNITFYKSTNLSMSFENSLYFSSTSAKDDYWTNATEYICARANKCSYQRLNRGTIRVEIPIATLYQADYMRFKNNSFENKFFYAFVTSVNYVNNVTTEVNFMLDPLMTWMGEFGLGQCLVLREHSRTDNVGDSLTDEGLQLGDYTIDHVYSLPKGVDYNDYRIVIAYADENARGGLYGGVYSGTVIDYCPTPEIANSTIDELVENNLADNITGIFMIPGYLAGNDDGVYDLSFTFDKGNDDFDGYVPRNNKLFTYPYHKIVVANNTGDEQTYRAEFFTKTNEKLKFRVYATINESANMILIPQNYKGTGDNYEEILTMATFPMCSWNYDSYKAWLAQYNAYFPQAMDMVEIQNSARTARVSTANTASSYTTAMNAIASPILGALSGLMGHGSGQSSVQNSAGQGMFGGMLSGVGNAWNTYNTNKMNSLTATSDNAIDLESKAREGMMYNSVIPTTPQVLKGKATPNALFSCGALMGFRVYDKKIQSQFARSIDDYFTMYGYTLNQVTTPSMNNRKFYTYVKTSGCNLGGSLPSDDARAIENIFDTGVRFWKDLNDIGNYNLVNTPLGA